MPGFFSFHSLVALALVRQPTGAGKVISNLPVPRVARSISMPGRSAGSSGSSAYGRGASIGSSGRSAGTGAGTPTPIVVSRVCADAAKPLPAPTARSATSTAGPRQSMTGLYGDRWSSTARTLRW